MPRRVIGAQKPFKMLVANLRQGSDPSKGTSGNPVKVRSTYETQLFPQISGRGMEQATVGGKTPGRRTMQGRMVEVATAPTFAITVDAAVTVVTSAQTRIVMGDWTAVPDVDFAVVNGDTAATSINLAAYISATTGWTTLANLSIVHVTLPVGLEFEFMLLQVTGPDAGNYTLTPSDGYPNKAVRSIGPAIIG